MRSTGNAPWAKYLGADPLISLLSLRLARAVILPMLPAPLLLIIIGLCRRRFTLLRYHIAFDIELAFAFGRRRCGSRIP